MIKLYRKEPFIYYDERRKKAEKIRKQTEEKKTESRGNLRQDFEDVFTYENMVDASKSCCTGVRWKTSTINFETMLLTQADALQERILNDEYRFQGFTFQNHRTW